MDPSSATLGPMKGQCFIRIVGIPYKNELSDTVVVHSALEKPSLLPTIPSLSPTTGAQHLVDVIDASNEDPFTLEQYSEIIKTCAAHNKDFILARVTTADPEDESRFYSSYYVAHHINKVLFRTQPEEGLLHRMKAKNPLNNMTIIGDVHYYRIKSHSSSLADKFRKVFQTKRLNTVYQKKRPSAEDVFDYTTKTKESILISPGIQTKIISYRNEKHSLSVEDWINSHCTSPLSPDPRFYEAEYYASDDDFLMKSSVRAYFRAQALEQNDALLFNLQVTAEAPSLHFVNTVTQRRFFHHPYFKYVVILYIIVGIALIYLFVPSEFIYLAAFIQVFFLCVCFIFMLEFSQ